jgi:hypothetical protein
VSPTDPLFDSLSTKSDDDRRYLTTVVADLIAVALCGAALLMIAVVLSDRLSILAKEQ